MASNYVIVEDRNCEERKDYSNLDQTFQVEFNELLFISLALKLNRIFVDSLRN